MPVMYFLVLAWLLQNHVLLLLFCLTLLLPLICVPWRMLLFIELWLVHYTTSPLHGQILPFRLGNLHSPTNSDLVAAKHVLHYVNGSLTYGLLYKRSSSTADALCLSAYSDSDWAGDPSDRRLTTGFVIFLDSNLVSWVAKKQ